MHVHTCFKQRLIDHVTRFALAFMLTDESLNLIDVENDLSTLFLSGSKP